MGALAKFLSWILRKLTFGIVLLGLGLAGFALWLYLRDNASFELRQQTLLRELTGKNNQLRAALAGVESRLARMRVDLPREEQRATEAARIAAELEELNSGLIRLSTSSEQIRENERRITTLRTTEADARAKVATLRDELMRTQWEKDGLEIALAQAQRDLAKAEASKSKVLHYTREAWARHGLTVALIAAVYFLGPPLLRALLFFIVAPIVSRRRPVRLGAVTAAKPAVTTSEASVEVPLEPGDVLWVKETFLQGSDEGLLRSMRWILDWRMPFTCLATGLKELVELRNASPAATLRALFSSQRSPHVELAVVSVPAGTSLVLRPSFLAGMVGPVGRRSAVIRRHWRLFALQSWATGQFRYFEFVGPCRLLVAGARGIRVETLEADSSRRINQDATVGFTPGLGWRPVRAETFWAYLRGMNPLFDDSFEGEGIFLCQRATVAGEAAEQRGVVGKLGSGLLRIFGL